MSYTSPYSFLPDEHMRLVGIIAFHWEAVDLSLQRAVAEITMTDCGGIAILTDMIGFRSKTEIIMAYARQFQSGDPLKWKEFVSALEGVKDAYTLRNKFVHARWIDGPDTTRPLRVDFRLSGGRLKQEEVPTEIGELYAAATAIFNAGGAMTTCLWKCGLMLPSQETPA
ncbi:hypothetical protein [Hyphomicrobium sp. ghe19]|uniref:hypothetical protein n=1 Tax=Hyphomicrobium sp. ghe19 TaxID=2682968 RepID=UPI001366823F|nr:hypothetical protein HYPP_02844 [Hyphomicrobium sp. ghe19]